MVIDLSDSAIRGLFPSAYDLKVFCEVENREDFDRFRNDPENRRRFHLDDGIGGADWMREHYGC